MSLNTTSGMVTSFELSDNTNERPGEQESEYEQGEDELGYHKSDGPEFFTHEYPAEGQYEGHDAELAEEPVEYVEGPEDEPLYSDEVLDIEINEPLDEFTVSLPPLCGRRQRFLHCSGRQGN